MTPPTPAAPAAPATPRSLSIHAAIAAVVVFSMLLVASAVVGLGWVGARANVLATAARIATDSGLLVTERARRLLEPAQSTMRQLTFDPITRAGTLDERLSRIHVLSEELVANQLISAIFVGYEDGQFVLVRPLDKPAQRKLFSPPPRSNFVVQSQVLDRAGRMVGEHLFFDTERRLIERRAVPGYQYDPRGRPWYKAAQDSGQSTLSEPYVFFTTREVGVTLSQVSHAPGAVIGIDVVLDDLSLALGGMRMSPGAQIALVNTEQEVLAYPDMQRVLEERQGRYAFRQVSALGEPGLARLAALNPPLGEARLLTVQGQDLLGIALPFNVWPNREMRVLVTAPVDELLGDLPAKRRRLILLVVGLVAVMLLLSWPLAGRMGRGIEALTAQARSIGRFHFGTEVPRASRIAEVRELGVVMQGMDRTIESFLRLSQQMATEPDVEKMLDQVLAQLVRATRCRAGAVYLWESEPRRMLRTAVHGLPPGTWAASVAAHAPPAQWWAEDGQHTQVPCTHLALKGRQGLLQGHLVLVHEAGAAADDPAFCSFAQRLSGMLAVSIETRQLIGAQKKLLDAVIRLMADAIDAKSPYTGGHCERVPELATWLVDRMSADTEGPYAGFHMSEAERYEFHLAAWLHDCGKVTSPEHIVDKATKLEVIHNRIHEVRMRFEVLWRDAEIECLQALAEGQPGTEARARLLARQQQLQADFAFVAQCNVGGESMSDEAVVRLRALAVQPWWRHFDHRLGLSVDELRRLQAAEPSPPALPVAEALLADRPEHLVAWDGHRPAVEKGDPHNRLGFDMVLPPHKQNQGELHNLSVRRGTLTEEDRFRINDHIVQTYVMLHGLPWPEALRRVPEIAATHHERLDGQGYPRKLPADRLTPADRVMALADVFEALTAADRPYKVAKTLSESLRIMAHMCHDRHLDAGLFRYFLHSRLWLTFAERYLRPEQIDEVDIAALELLLPASPPPA